MRQDNGDCAVKMAQEEPTKFINWRIGAAREILMEDLEPGGWLYGREDEDPAVVFAVYRPQQEIQILDEPDSLLPAPSFVSELHLTVKDLFAWLVL